MFGLQSRGRQGGGRGRDERLTALLREWQGVEPLPGFDAAVWRRIRAAADPEPSVRSRFGMICEWLVPHPVWAAAMAMIVASVIGGLAGVSTSTADSRRHASEPLLHPRTLAGSYLHATAGGHR